eukprot:scaffold127215_cov28-Tisochrysis_lutea.AAC.1
MYLGSAATATATAQKAAASQKSKVVRGSGPSRAASPLACPSPSIHQRQQHARTWLTAWAWSPPVLAP